MLGTVYYEESCVMLHTRYLSNVTLTTGAVEFKEAWIMRWNCPTRCYNITQKSHNGRAIEASDMYACSGSTRRRFRKLTFGFEWSFEPWFTHTGLVRRLLLSLSLDLALVRSFVPRHQICAWILLIITKPGVTSTPNVYLGFSRFRSYVFVWGGGQATWIGSWLPRYVCCVRSNYPSHPVRCKHYMF